MKHFEDKLREELESARRVLDEARGLCLRGENDGYIFTKVLVSDAIALSFALGSHDARFGGRDG